MHPRAIELIDKLDLQPHPEGGFYKEVFRSATLVQSPNHGKSRSSVTDIYFLLPAGQISRFHRVLHEEIWNFYEGAPLRLIEMTPDLNHHTSLVLGGSQSICYKHCIPALHWQAAESTGEYSLVGCTVAPGFDFEDFSFLTLGESGCIEKSFPELNKFL